jgi:hypothetical protein
METLLTESMISSFSFSGLRLLSFVFWASTGKLTREALLEASFETAGNFRQNGTQLVVYRISRRTKQISIPEHAMPEVEGEVNIPSTSLSGLDGQGILRLGEPTIECEPVP